LPTFLSVPLDEVVDMHVLTILNSNCSIKRISAFFVVFYSRLQYLEAQVAGLNLRPAGTSNSKFALSRNLSFNNPADLYQGYNNITNPTSRVGTSNTNTFSVANNNGNNTNNNTAQGPRRGGLNSAEGIQNAAVTQIMSDIDFKVRIVVVVVADACNCSAPF